MADNTTDLKPWEVNLPTMGDDGTLQTAAMPSIPGFEPLSVPEQSALRPWELNLPVTEIAPKSEDRARASAKPSIPRLGDKPSNRPPFSMGTYLRNTALGVPIARNYISSTPQVEEFQKRWPSIARSSRGFGAVAPYMATGPSGTLFGTLPRAALMGGLIEGGDAATSGAPGSEIALRSGLGAASALPGHFLSRVGSPRSPNSAYAWSRNRMNRAGEVAHRARPNLDPDIASFRRSLLSRSDVDGIPNALWQANTSLVTPQVRSAAQNVSRNLPQNIPNPPQGVNLGAGGLGLYIGSQFGLPHGIAGALAGYYGPRIARAGAQSAARSVNNIISTPGGNELLGQPGAAYLNNQIFRNPRVYAMLQALLQPSSKEGIMQLGEQQLRIPRLMGR